MNQKAAMRKGFLLGPATSPKKGNEEQKEEKKEEKKNVEEGAEKASTVEKKSAEASAQPITPEKVFEPLLMLSSLEGALFYHF